MSDVSQGPGWWLASDNKWYPPELSPGWSQATDGPVPTADTQIQGVPEGQIPWNPAPTVPRSHPGGSPDIVWTGTDVNPSATSIPPDAPGSTSSGRSKRRPIAALGTLVLVAILAVGLFAALGSGASANGLAGKTASRILAMTLAAARREGSVHLSESDKPTGGGTYDVGSNRGKQTIADGSEGNAALLVLPGIAYLKGDSAFLQDQLGLSISDASLYAQHWISFLPNDPAYDYQQLVQGDTLGSALSESVPSGHLTQTSERTIDGESVVGVSGSAGGSLPKGAKESAVLYVSTAAPYLPVEFVETGAYEGRTGDSTLTFSNWGEPISVAAPGHVTPESAISSSES
jgi:hypothetical protein